MTLNKTYWLHIPCNNYNKLATIFHIYFVMLLLWLQLFFSCVCFKRSSFFLRRWNLCSTGLSGSISEAAMHSHTMTLPPPVCEFQSAFLVFGIWWYGLYISALFFKSGIVITSPLPVENGFVFFLTALTIHQLYLCSLA